MQSGLTKQRLLAGLILFLVSAGLLGATDRVALMRGVVAERGISQFRWIGNEATLERVRLAGVTGQETRDANVLNIRAQISLYEVAQKSRLGSRGRSEPLHILLDPNESWAFARWGHSFRLTYPDGRVTAPDTGFIHMGEQFDYRGRSVAPAAADASLRRRDDS